MGEHTKIEWTDKTWNPVVGCTEVSEACLHCYARDMATRFPGSAAFPNGFEVTLRPERLDDPASWTRPSRVFVNSTSDLFHAKVPDAFRDDIFTVMENNGRHQFQVLTKRPGPMLSYLTRRYPVDGPFARQAPEQLWVGVSVESQAWARRRIPLLLAAPAGLRFLSCEPLLSPVDLSDFIRFRCDWCATEGGWPGEPEEEWWCPRCGRRQICAQARCAGPDWVIAGGESGTRARPAHPDWIRSLRDQCACAGIPFFFKQWGTWAPVDPPAKRWVDHDGQVWRRPPQIAHELITWEPVARLGKGAAGRVLDGTTHEEYPAARGGASPTRVPAPRRPEGTPF